jgi:hypothetical protein
MKKNLTISAIFNGVATGLIISGLTAGAIVAYGMSQAESRRQELAEQKFVVDSSRLTGVPAVNQSSIEIATKAFGIQMPKAIRGPYFDQKLEDRGLTLRNGLASDPVVLIGREAFTSWAMLGSTLAHEIEIHCRQNFLSIHLQNLAGFDGTGTHKGKTKIDSVFSFENEVTKYSQNSTIDEVLFLQLKNKLRKQEYSFKNKLIRLYNKIAGK